MTLASEFKVNLKLEIKMNINGCDLFVILKSLTGLKRQNHLKTWEMFIREYETVLGKDTKGRYKQVLH